MILGDVRILFRQHGPNIVVRTKAGNLYVLNQDQVDAYPDADRTRDAYVYGSRIGAPVGPLRRNMNNTIRWFWLSSVTFVEPYQLPQARKS